MGLPLDIVALAALLALVDSGANMSALIVVVLAGLAIEAPRVALLRVLREAAGHSAVVGEYVLGRVLASWARFAGR
jgi:hypothetical protein